MYHSAKRTHVHRHISLQHHNNDDAQVVTLYLMAWTDNPDTARAISEKNAPVLPGYHTSDGTVVRLQRPKHTCCQHPECTKQAFYGAPDGDRATHCGQHRPSGAIDHINRRCEAPGCTILVGSKRTLCANHDVHAKRPRVREAKVAVHLRDAGLSYTSWNKQLVETACGRYRPDFVFERTTHVVIVEVDEFQHAAPGYSCDNKRMLDVYNSYGGMPVVFLRFNPDDFALAGKTVTDDDIPLKQRMMMLEGHVRAALDRVPKHQLTITRLFYNDACGRTVVTTTVQPDDPAFTERPLVA